MVARCMESGVHGLDQGGEQVNNAQPEAHRDKQQDYSVSRNRSGQSLGGSWQTRLPHRLAGMHIYGLGANRDLQGLSSNDGVRLRQTTIQSIHTRFIHASIDSLARSFIHRSASLSSRPPSRAGWCTFLTSQRMLRASPRSSPSRLSMGRYSWCPSGLSFVIPRRSPHQCTRVPSRPHPYRQVAPSLRG